MADAVKKEWHINGVRYLTRHAGVDSTLPHLLMLHGFMGDGRAFSHLMDPLTEFCTPVAVDLLGHGGSEDFTDPERYREERQLEDLRELTTELQLERPFIYGYSMGGRLALKLSLQYPHLFRGVILESTHYGLDDEETRKYRRREDARRAQKIEEDFSSFLHKWEKLALFHSPDNIDPDLQQRYHTMQHSQNPKAMSASLRGFGTGEMKPAKNELSTFDRPLLFLAGSEDEKYVDIAHTMERLLPRAEGKIIRAGHRVHLDNPRQLLDEIANFIDKHTPS